LSAMSEKPRRIEGSCHCGGVRFAVQVGELRALDCNCSICRKKGFLHVISESADFRLLSGRELLTTYTFNSGVAKHHFCSVCGIHPFYVPRSHPDGFSINARCLERPLEDFEVQPFDGQNWEETVEQIR
jgi:hypothetical protein